MGANLAGLRASLTAMLDASRGHSHDAGGLPGPAPQHRSSSAGPRPGRGGSGNGGDGGWHMTRHGVSAPGGAWREPVLPRPASAASLTAPHRDLRSGGGGGRGDGARMRDGPRYGASGRGRGRGGRGRSAAPRWDARQSTPPQPLSARSAPGTDGRVVAGDVFSTPRGMVSPASLMHGDAPAEAARGVPTVAAVAAALEAMPLPGALRGERVVPSQRPDDWDAAGPAPAGPLQDKSGGAPSADAQLDSNTPPWGPVAAGGAWSKPLSHAQNSLRNSADSVKAASPPGTAATMTQLTQAVGATGRRSGVRSVGGGPLSQGSASIPGDGTARRAHSGGFGGGGGGARRRHLSAGSSRSPRNGGGDGGGGGGEGAGGLNAADFPSLGGAAGVASSTSAAPASEGQPAQQGRSVWGRSGLARHAGSPLTSEAGLSPSSAGGGPSPGVAWASAPPPSHFAGGEGGGAAVAVTHVGGRGDGRGGRGRGRSQHSEGYGRTPGSQGGGVGRWTTGTAWGAGGGRDGARSGWQTRDDRNGS